MVQNDKTIVCYVPYLRNHTSYDCSFWYTCVKWYYLQGVFFHFFKILIFCVVRGVKGQKMVQNGKQFCPSRLISQEPYIIWLSFSVHCYKMMISSGVSFIFSKLWFSGSIGGGWGKRAKDGPGWKNSACHAQYLKNHTSYDCHLWCKCVKW